MAQETGSQEKRYDITYFDGVNSTVQHLLAKRTELFHAENMRSPVVGVLEKREGQTKIGTDGYGGYFNVSANYGITHQQNNDQSSEGVYRLCAMTTTTGTITLSVGDDVSVADVIPSAVLLFVNVWESITITEPTIYRRLDVSTVILDGTTTGADLWTLRTNGQWEKLTDADAQGIIGATADFVNVDGNLVVVNGKDYNRMIDQNGSTVTTSADAGSLFNSPRASKVTYYKSRIYLADFTRSGIRYPTTVLQSSYAMGIIALINGDALTKDAGGSGDGAWTLEVTSTKYFYTDSGMNTYEVYRGVSKIATLVVTAINATSITCTVTFETVPITYSTFESADEIWISGTYNGEKQYRWLGNPTNTGQNVKQYDTFKLSGGQQDAITLFETVGNVILIANKNAMMSWNDYTLQNFDLGIGCPSKNGATKVLGYLYFLHYSGIYSTSGAMPTLLSRKIEKYVRGATRDGIENASAGYKGLSVFFGIGDVTLYNDDGSLWKVLPDVCVEYDLAQQNWYVHRNVPAEYFATFVDKTGSERLLMAHGGTGKHVKEFLSGSTDDGEEVVSRADTQLIQFSTKAEVFNNPVAVITEIDRGSLTKCFVSLDKDPYYEILGSFEKGVSTLKITNKTATRESPVLCKRMRLSFRDASKQRNRIVQTSISYSEGTKTQAR